MDIDGLSIQTMLRFMNAGFIHEFADIFRLKEHFGEISQMEGFGENLWQIWNSPLKKPAGTSGELYICPVHTADRCGCREKIVAAIGFEGFCNVCIRGTGLRILRGSERNVPDQL